MDFQQPYTDSTLLTFGKYKFVALCRVPAEYLLHIYYKENKHDKYPNRELIEYIKNNLEKIEARNEGFAVAPKLEIPCEKYVYPSKKDANHTLNRINEKAQEHKKPVRSYECDKCGGWHLTSIPYEEWRVVNK